MFKIKLENGIVKECSDLFVAASELLTNMGSDCTIEEDFVIEPPFPVSEWTWTLLTNYTDAFGSKQLQGKIEPEEKKMFQPYGPGNQQHLLPCRMLADYLSMERVTRVLDDVIVDTFGMMDDHQLREFVTTNFGS